MPEAKFYINSTIKSYPAFPYQSIKEAILGKGYQLSLTFIGEKKARALNTTYRHKTYVPNVLSFPLDEKNGDIFICPAIAYPEAKDYFLSKEGYIAFLFIHGCLHLKGFDHSDKMEALERKFVKQFKIV
jgi:probable rRNA maturation factor